MNFPNIPEGPPIGDQLPPMSKRTLLQKYEIPVSHLDFDYVRACQDAKEVERMLLILKSGEEGHFPDLQRCTEQRLHKLNPRSKMLRAEEPMLRSNALPMEEQDQVNSELKDFFNDIHKIKLDREQTAQDKVLDDNLPSIRKMASSNATANTTPLAKENRIRSCDYDQWDKYDAETEITKLDLSAERNREAADIKKNQEAKVYRNLDEAVRKVEVELSAKVCRMSPVERGMCANRYRMQGNELFKAGDFEEAVLEYTRSLAVTKTAAACSNRAMAYIKLKRNTNAISDCDECLQIDATNVKALLRKGQALVNEDRNMEAFRVYSQVIKIDANNAIASKAITDLRDKIGEVPPENAFRMKIDEDDGKVAAKPTTPAKLQPKPKDYGQHMDVDFAQLIIPKKIVPSRMAQMAQTMKQLNQQQPTAPSSGQSNKQQQQPSIRTQCSAQPRNEMTMKVPPVNNAPNKTTKYSNGVIIEEL